MLSYDEPTSRYATPFPDIAERVLREAIMAQLIVLGYPELVGFGFDDATPGRAEPVTFPVATHHAPTVVLSGHDPDQVRAHVVGMDGGRS